MQKFGTFFFAPPGIMVVTPPADDITNTTVHLGHCVRWPVEADSEE